MSQTPSVGRIVHYKLSSLDASEINRRRYDYATDDPDRVGRSGHVAHVGTMTNEGDVFPAMIVRTTEHGPDVINLQVTLDGNDALWAPSRSQGEKPGTWHWPERTA